MLVKEVKVVAGLYCYDGKVLVLRRSSDAVRAKGYSNLWEYPGGKPEGGECVEAVLVREWWQELGVVVIGIGREISTTVVERPIMKVTIRLFEVRGFDGEPRPCEDMHDEVGWFDDRTIAGLTAAAAPGIHGMRADVLRYMDSCSRIRRTL